MDIIGIAVPPIVRVGVFPMVLMLGDAENSARSFFGAHAVLGELGNLA